jgi:hypothetical protein
MRKSLVAIVVCSCVAFPVCGAPAETTRTATLKAGDTKQVGTSAVPASTEAEKNPYSKADSEWHAYLRKYGYEVDSNGKLMRKEWDSGNGIFGPAQPDDSIWGSSRPQPAEGVLQLAD